MRLFLRRFSFLLLGAMLQACGDDPAADDGLTSDDHLGNARIFLEQSNQQEAIIELKAALKKDVNNAQASALLGEVYFEAGAFQDADKELARALAAGESTPLIVPMLAQVLLSLGEFERLDNLPFDGLDPESRSVVQAAKGLSMIYRGNPVLAAEIMDAALENEPASPYAEVAAARLLMEVDDYDGAQNQLKDIISRFPKYAPAWSLLGDIASAQGRPRSALNAYNNVLKLSGGGFEAVLNKGLMQLYMDDFKGARKSISMAERAFRSARDHPGVLFATALIYLNNKQLNPALKTFFAVSKYSDDYPQCLYYIATIYVEQELPELALSYAYKFLGMVPDSVAGGKLAAKLELGRKGYKEAEKPLLRVLARRPDDTEALNLLARALLGQGRNSAGVERLARVVELQPDSLEARARLGAGLLAAGSEQSGIKTLQDLLSVDPGYEQADILIVLEYLRTERVDEAIQAAQAYRQRNPSSATSYDLLGHAYLASGRPEMAKVAFSKALELEPGEPDASNSLANFALLEKDYEAVRRYYEQVLEHNPDHLQTRIKVAASYAEEGREQEMLDSLQGTLDAIPRAMEPRLVKARYYMARGQLDAVPPLFLEFTEEQLGHPHALATMAGFQLAAGRYNQALEILRNLIRIRPDVGQYHYMLAKAYAKFGDTKRLIAELERTVELDPDHFYAKIATARLDLLSHRHRRFEKNLAELRALAPENPDVMKLEVVSAQRAGDNETAKRLLENLYEREPSTNNVIALAAHRHSMGDVEGAITQLQRWLEVHSRDSRVREKLAEIYAGSNRLGGAVYQYREILKVEPEHVIALNNLAWNLLEEDPEQALDYAEKANRLSPDSSSILDTLAISQLKNNRIAEARRSIDRARALAPGRPELRYHEARIMAAEGDATGAINELSSLLAKEATFPERAAAEVFLKQLE